MDQTALELSGFLRQSGCPYGISSHSFEFAAKLADELGKGVAGLFSGVMESHRSQFCKNASDAKELWRVLAFYGIQLDHSDTVESTMRGLSMAASHPPSKRLSAEQTRHAFWVRHNVVPDILRQWTEEYKIKVYVVNRAFVENYYKSRSTSDTRYTGFFERIQWKDLWNNELWNRLSMEQKEGPTLHWFGKPFASLPRYIPEATPRSEIGRIRPRMDLVAGAKELSRQCVEVALLRLFLGNCMWQHALHFRNEAEKERKAFDHLRQIQYQRYDMGAEFTRLLTETPLRVIDSFLEKVPEDLNIRNEKDAREVYNSLSTSYDLLKSHEPRNPPPVYSDAKAPEEDTISIPYLEWIESIPHTHVIPHEQKDRVYFCRWLSESWNRVNQAVGESRIVSDDMFRVLLTLRSNPDIFSKWSKTAINEIKALAEEVSRVSNEGVQVLAGRNLLSGAVLDRLQGLHSRIKELTEKRWEAIRYELNKSIAKHLEPILKIIGFNKPVGEFTLRLRAQATRLEFRSRLQTGKEQLGRLMQISNGGETDLSPDLAIFGREIKSIQESTESSPAAARYITECSVFFQELFTQNNLIHGTLKSRRRLETSFLENFAEKCTEFEIVSKHEWQAASDLCEDVQNIKDSGAMRDFYDQFLRPGMSHVSLCTRVFAVPRDARDDNKRPLAFLRTQEAVVGKYKPFSSNMWPLSPDRLRDALLFNTQAICRNIKSSEDKDNKKDNKEIETAQSLVFGSGRAPVTFELNASLFSALWMFRERTAKPTDYDLRTVLTHWACSRLAWNSYLQNTEATRTPIRHPLSH